MCWKQFLACMRARQRHTRIFNRYIVQGAGLRQRRRRLRRKSLHSASIGARGRERNRSAAHSEDCVWCAVSGLGQGPDLKLATPPDRLFLIPRGCAEPPPPVCVTFLEYRTLPGCRGCCTPLKIPFHMLPAGAVWPLFRWIRWVDRFGLFAVDYGSVHSVGDRYLLKSWILFGSR